MSNLLFYYYKVYFTCTHTHVCVTLIGYFKIIDEKRRHKKTEHYL